MESKTSANLAYIRFFTILRMQESTPREKMLKRIRQALIHKTNPRFPSLDWEKNVYTAADGDSPEEQFAKAFTKIGGQFVFCENELDAMEQLIQLAGGKGWKQIYCWEPALQNLLTSLEFPFTDATDSFPEGMVAVTTCEALVCRLGSVIVSSRQGSGRRLFVSPTYHILFATTKNLVPELKDAFQLIKDKYGDDFPSMIASISGPSRTADIEKTLVTPAHGPKEIYVFLIDQPE